MTIPVADVNAPEVLERQHGIDAYQALQGQLTAVQGVLATKQPDKVLMVGGDCAVSLAPFNYLSGRYGRDLGVVWLDTHPDISTTEESHHLHEMVVSSLLGKGAPGFNAHHPLASDQVILAGLIEEDLRPMDHNVFDYQVQRMTPKQLREPPNALSDWVRGHGFKQVAVHFDLDALSPTAFRSIYPAEPGTDPADFPATVGQLTLPEVANLLTQLDQNAELVGLTVAEHMAWDAPNLRQSLSGLSLLE